MRTPRKVDANHRQIADALRDIHAFVLDVHTLAGCLDLLVAFRGQLYLMEIKDGDKPAWARTLTPAEQHTIRQLAAVGVDALVVHNVEEALRAIGAIL